MINGLIVKAYAMHKCYFFIFDHQNFLNILVKRVSMYAEEMPNYDVKITVFGPSCIILLLSNLIYFIDNIHNTYFRFK